ncbi:MAG: guanine deaminase [Bacteroidales bacterium]|nr:guanine deaminase [Bacteroidales bacterium]
MLKGFRGSLFDFYASTDVFNLKTGYRYIEDGLLVTKDGKVLASGNYPEVIKEFPLPMEITDFGETFIFPGFIDAHVHSVQTGAIASYGNQLLEWLETYIFPRERHFSDSEYAFRHTRFFIDQLLKNGTTTAVIYPAVFDASVEAVFKIAAQLNMRIITGKTWMDRNAPDYLLEKPEISYESSKRQIIKWHGCGRLSYAITPRYAITSSPESLKIASSLLKEYEGLYVQTHISENKQEVELVNHNYNNHKGYLDVYDSFGLLTSRTLLGHGIYLNSNELKRISHAGASIVHCPSSNLFLGSGLFDYHKTLEYGIKMAVGSDVGGGTSFSMLNNLHDAYKISALKNHLNCVKASSTAFAAMSALEAFYFITLGGAKALKLEDKIGNFDPGKEADFIVIDPSLNELLNYRLQEVNSIEELLFALMMLGDEKMIKATYLMGEKVNFTK